MEFRQLGGSGLKVPALCLGTGTFGAKKELIRAFGVTEIEEATKLVDIALEAGLNMFDSADVYSDGAAEEVLGKAIRGRRDQIIISTKATFRSGPGDNDVGSSRHHLIKACESSLRRLGTDFIDLYQLHGFDALTPVEETLSALDDMVHSGKVRYIGCSNFSGWHLMKSLALSEKYGLSRYVAHQAYYSLVGRHYEWELMPRRWIKSSARLPGVLSAGVVLPGRFAAVSLCRKLVVFTARPSSTPDRRSPTITSIPSWTPSTLWRRKLVKPCPKSQSTGYSNDRPCAP
jgi:aryl-alcohol dehydrogenase-like predicted oxidoreductase